MAFARDPITGKAAKSGGRKAGVPNRTTSARYAAMARVNEALSAIGEDTITGMKLLKEVLNHKETPLDVKIQYAQILVKEENAPAEDHKYVCHMPPALPGDTPQEQLAVWMALYMKADGDDESQAATNRILELAATKEKPATL